MKLVFTGIDNYVWWTIQRWLVKNHSWRIEVVPAATSSLAAAL